MDAARHANNLMYLRWIETSRIELYHYQDLRKSAIPNEWLEEIFTLQTLSQGIVAPLFVFLKGHSLNLWYNIES